MIDKLNIYKKEEIKNLQKNLETRIKETYIFESDLDEIKLFKIIEEVFESFLIV